MSQTRKIRIEYYLVVIAPNNVYSNNADKLFDLEDVIEIADTLTLEERTFDYYQEKARLDQLKYNDTDKYWYLNFLRLRQTKIPSKAKKDAIAEPIKLSIDEYIGEDVSALYDTQNHIMALQRNRDSLSSTGLESYLNSLYRSGTHEIHLRPISPKDIDMRISRARIFRKITVRFAAMPDGRFSNNENSSLGNMVKNFKTFGAKTATLVLSLGHLKKGSLDQETIMDTINELKENIGIISDAELSIKNSETDPIDVIDLFSMKSHDFITIKVKELETISFISMMESILIKYNKSKPVLLEALRE